ncbi:MAG: MarR family transcriptional regulator [Acidobacteriaceae bacterium]|jgi:DNA-binding MarR family transcriptional regulator
MGKKKAKPERKEKETMQDLAWFRYNLRRFLRFSEKAARACGVTPQQHQLMLGIAGFTDDGRATISDLAEFLQERNNSVVGLVERAAESGLVRRRASTTDRRQVVVTLTARGKEILSTLTELHHEEVRRVKAGFLTRPQLKREPTSGENDSRTRRRGQNG